MQNPVMRAPETVAGENLVGIGREIPVSEEEQFDDIEIDAIVTRERGTDRFCVTCRFLGHFRFIF
jgi:hypothetical protein